MRDKTVPCVLRAFRRRQVYAREPRLVVDKHHSLRGVPNEKLHLLSQRRESAIRHDRCLRVEHRGEIRNEQPRGGFVAVVLAEVDDQAVAAGIENRVLDLDLFGFERFVVGDAEWGGEGGRKG